jgi:arylsulfatase A-like enzyme
MGAERPNVLIVITDDQGYGDLGAHGNPVVKTPNLDTFAKTSVRLRNFHVSPVCSPTRSSLLTGLYNYRTGVVDTFLGRSMMRPDVKTLAEYLASAGYRTGLFGKWHLGDNYPLRPEDRGFQETLWHHGGGLAQPSDPPEQDPKAAYFDPILTRNGKEVKTKGYCTDVFSDAALKFIAEGSKKPFFAYVAFNCPHSPYQAPEELAKPYAKLDLTQKGFPQIGQPWATKKLNVEEIARTYGMIENVDANFGRLILALDDAKLAGNTIVLFLTDNGPGGVRWNAGLRNRKGTVYDGGIRVPCYLRWPNEIIRAGGRSVAVPLAHIDITPTLLTACGVETDDTFDGRDFLPLVKPGKVNWPDRTLFFQWHRGDAPEKYRAFAARGERYKLVQAAGVPQGAQWRPKFELFDLIADPFEEKDLAAEKPEEVAKLKAEYEAWFAEVTQKGFAPPRIVIGSEKANPVRLSRQDWRGPKAGWTRESVGHWEATIERDGRYEVTVRSRAEFERYSVSINHPTRSIGFGGGLGSSKPERPIAHALSTTTELSRGNVQVKATVTQGDQSRGVDYLELKYLGPGGKK